MKINVPVRIISEANNTDHWTKKNKRKKLIRFYIHIYLKGLHKPPLPVKITFTRIAPRSLDIDNLWASMKTPIDVVCDWMIPGLKPGQADSDRRIEIDCKQRKGGKGQYALEIELVATGGLK